MRMAQSDSALTSASPAVHAHAREPAFCYEFYRLFGLTRCLVEGRKADNMRDQFCPASDHGPIDGFLELSAFASGLHDASLEWWQKKAPKTLPQWPN